MNKPVIVVGAGIAGLSAAFSLKQAGAEVIVLEANDRAGGKIQTSPVNDIVIDEAADAFLARVPEGTELAKALGLTDQLISPATSNACVWKNGGLRSIPQPNFLGVPLEPENLEPSALLPQKAIDALKADLERIELDPPKANETLGAFIRRRLGNEVFASLINPLIGSINAGDCDQLSIMAVAPQFAAAANQHPSLIQGLRDARSNVDAASPVFYSFRNGMSTLINALHLQLGDSVRLNRRVTGLERTRRGINVQSSGETFTTDACILTVPAPAAMRLVGAWPEAVDALRTIEYVSVVMVTLVYRRSEVPDVPADMSGFLVPAGSNTMITACSFASQKWPELADEDQVVLRVSLGHYGADAIVNGTDTDIMTVVRQDLRSILGIEAAPEANRITRWPKSFPQYKPGHAAQVAKVRAALNPQGLFVAGAAYDGLGVPACIRQGQKRAETVLNYLQHQ